jgi:hypothetical protein
MERLAQGAESGRAAEVAEQGAELTLEAVYRDYGA